MLRQLLFSALFLLNFSKSAYADDKSPIKIGSSLSLSSQKNSAIGVRQGIDTYIAKINASGGIQGRKVEMVILDDGYEPERAAANVRQLIQKDQVLALLSNNGSPTNLVVLPIIDKYKTLLFAPHTGPAFLYKTPPDRYVFNFRASYKDEVTTMIKGVLSTGIKPDQFAFFTQNDAYGDAIYNSAMEILKAEGFPNPESLPYGRYNTDQVNVVPGFATIVEEAQTPPKAIILGGLSNPNAQFINLAKSQFPNALFLTPAAGLVLATDLESQNATIIVTQIAPPLESNLPAVLEYLEDLKKYNPSAEPDAVSLESYLATKLFVVGLQKAAAANKLSREGIIDVLETLTDVDIGIGIKISFSKTDHQALHKVWPVILKNGKYVSLDWSQLRQE